MNNPATIPVPSTVDLLGIYVDGVSKLPGKLAVIAANQRHSQQSLGRAAAALRSMGALNQVHRNSDFRNNPPNIEKAPGASS